jgi:lysozyme family protein
MKTTNLQTGNWKFEDSSFMIDALKKMGFEKVAEYHIPKNPSNEQWDGYNSLNQTVLVSKSLIIVLYRIK